VDELIKVWDEELTQFVELRDKEAAAVAALEQRVAGESIWYRRSAPHPATLENTASLSGVLGGYGNQLEWVEPGNTIGVRAGEEFAERTLNSRTLPQVAESPSPELRLDVSVGFRCVIPLIRVDMPRLGRFTPKRS
jgi:hypothetical protein